MLYAQKILLVEDFGLIALDIKTMLISTGFPNIKVAYNGQEAINISEIYAPDLILMDIMLGDGINGIETARTICKVHPIPIIYITGSTDKETQKEARNTSPAAIIHKPIYLPELEYSVKSALGINPDFSIQAI